MDCDIVGNGRSGSTSEAMLIREYRMVFLKGCLSESGQRELWDITKASRL